MKQTGTTASPQKKRRFPCELALVAGVTILGFSVTILTKSRMGLVAVDLFYFTLWQVFPQLSYGVWANIFQGFMLLLLIILMRRVKVAYFFTFLVAFAGGRLIDLFTWLLAPLPEGLPIRILYFIAGFFLTSVGLALIISCRLPIFPFDLFTREIPQRYNITYKRLRTCLDVVLLLASLALGWFMLGGFPGFGVGTFLMAAGMGTIAGFGIRLLQRHFTFQPSFRLFTKLMD